MIFEPVWSGDEARFTVEFKQPTQEAAVEWSGVVQVSDTSKIPHYSGATEVNPMPISQTLDTAQKYVEKDIKINRVPIRRYLDANGELIVVIGDDEGWQW